MRSTRPALPLSLVLSLLAGARAWSAPPRAPEEPGDSPVVIQVEPGAPSCDGLWAHACPEAMHCVDDPSDPCDPQHGGNDCIGVCVEDQASRPEPSCTVSPPGRQYVSREPALCARLRLTCADPAAAFSDPCGCGCERRAARGD